MLNVIIDIVIVYLLFGFITVARSLYCAVKNDKINRDNVLTPYYVFYCIIFWWAYRCGVIYGIYNCLKEEK